MPARTSSQNARATPFGSVVRLSCMPAAFPRRRVLTHDYVEVVLVRASAGTRLRSASLGTPDDMELGASAGAFRRVVVLGGAGFVGSHLCDRLLRDGSAVVCVDDHSTGDARNVGHLADDDRFETVDADITSELRVAGDVDAVFHLASPASPVHYLRAPIATLRAGSIGTFHAVELAAAKRARLVFASTSEVY